jgi:hypothetical protein
MTLGESYFARVERPPCNSTQQLILRSEARLMQAELIYELEGPAAALNPLRSLVSDFPQYGSAHHLLGRVYARLGDQAAMRESFMLVHALDTILDDALDQRDVVELDRAMSPIVAEVLSTLPTWLRNRVAPGPTRWRGRPTRQKVMDGLDPRSYATLEAVASDATSNREGKASSPMSLVLYRTNLLAGAEDEVLLRANLRAAVRALFRRLA